MKRRTRYTPQTLQKAITAYFAECENTLVDVTFGKTPLQVKKPPTVEGLSAFLQLSRRTLYRYMAGDYPSPDQAVREQVAEMLECARDAMTADMLEGALLGKYDLRICTLILNNRGYNEKQEMVSPEKMIVEWRGVSPEEIERWST